MAAVAGKIKRYRLIFQSSTAQISPADNRDFMKKSPESAIYLAIRTPAGGTYDAGKFNHSY